MTLKGHHRQAQTGPAHLVGPESMEEVLQVPSDLCILGASVEECLSRLALCVSKA